MNRSSTGEFVLRLIVVVALAIDAVVHYRLAPGLQQAMPEGIGGGAVFAIQATLAVIAGVYLLLRGSRPAYLVAALVLASAAAAVIMSSYTPTPAVGPIPAFYDPMWYPDKIISAIAEAGGAVLALVGAVIAGRRPARHVA